MADNDRRKLRIQKAGIVGYVLFFSVFGGCMPDFFPEKESAQPSPVQENWHAYKELYAFDRAGVPEPMAKTFFQKGVHTVLGQADVPTDGIDRIEVDLQRFAKKYQAEYRREGSTASIAFNTKPMVGRHTLPGAKDMVRGSQPTMYEPFTDLAAILNTEPDLNIIIHGHGSDWFKDDHGLAVELGFVEAESIKKLLFRVGLNEMNRVDNFGCDEEPGGTVVVTLVTPKVTEPYATNGQRL